MKLLGYLLCVGALMAQEPRPSPAQAGGGGGGSGSVTSVGLVGTANQITVTGASPITSSGSWTISFPTNVTLPGTTTGTFSGNVTGNLTGTASTATNALSLGGNLAVTYAPLASPTFTGTVAIGTTGHLTALGHNAMGAQGVVDGVSDPNAGGPGYSPLSVSETFTSLDFNLYSLATGAIFRVDVAGDPGGGAIGYYGSLSSANTNGAQSYAGVTLVGGSSIGNHATASAIGTVIGNINYAYNSGNGSPDSLWGTYGAAISSGGAVTDAMVSYSQVSINGGTAAHTYNYYAAAPSGGGTITNHYTLWGGDFHNLANSYYLWYDSPGVFRVKSDGVMAYYNPGFTKYTPGAVDYERVVQQWDGADGAEYGPEAGGTGTTRGLKLLGASLKVASLTSTGAATGKKIVCVDTATGQLYASSSGVACAN